jgi:ABC-type transport system involved in multi-copper enzyme maturation permease subunit
MAKKFVGRGRAIRHSSFVIFPDAMTAAIAKIKAHFANWREWEMNPIVIKELRQGVRSWTVTGMLLLFLVVLFLASLGFLITQSFDVSFNMGMGGRMFSTFVVILAGASTFFIPLYTGIRVAAERQDNNPDLLYVSTLSPTRIIFGKFLCSAYIVLLFFSACMPFMAFTNLMRGVDLPTVFYILFFLFLAVCATNMVAIFLACIPASRPFKVLFALAGFFLSFWVVVPMVAMSFEMMRSGVGAMMGERNFWIGTLTALLIGMAATGLLFVLSVALVAPPSANRALPVRIYLTAFWLLGGLVAFTWVWQTGEADRMLVWTYPTLVLMVMALLVVISNSDQLSLRVRRTIPRNGLKRFPAFLFFNGAAGGLLWVGAILMVTYLVTWAIIAKFPSTGIVPDDTKTSFAIMTAYAFAYGLTALSIHRKFVSRRPAKLTGLIAVLLAGGWAIVPSIFLFFANQLSWKSVEGLQLGNVFNVYFNRDGTQLIYHEYFAFAWLLLAILVNGKWFTQQMQNFRPPEKADVVPPNPDVPPVPAK